MRAATGGTRAAATAGVPPAGIARRQARSFVSMLRSGTGILLPPTPPADFRDGVTAAAGEAREGE